MDHPRVRLSGLAKYVNLFVAREDECPPVEEKTIKLSCKVMISIIYDLCLSSDAKR